MFCIFCRSVLILLLTSNAIVLSQDDYEYYDEWDEPYISPYPQRQRLYDNERGQRYRVAQFSPLSEKDKNQNKGRGVVGSAFGKVSATISNILGLGKCLIKCVTAWIKTCGGVISCPWNCLFPDKKLPELKESGSDQDISLEEPDVRVEVAKVQQNKSFASFLTPSEIVLVVRCYVKCLVRYLPRDIISLTQMLTCVVMRCLCGTSKTNRL